MDIYTKLVLVKNSNSKKFEDKTADIYSYKNKDNKVEVSYIKNVDKAYHFNISNILVFESPKKINLDEIIVCISGFPIREPSLVLDFGEYIKVFDSNEKTEIYHKSKVTYENSCLSSNESKAVFDYLKKLSQDVSVMKDGRTPLFDQYNKMTKVSENSILSTYLSGKNIKNHAEDAATIFPFGFNLSQKQAVNKALENNVSVIEGPPGTGKTQTILNIIANVASRGKTVGVVSGNNSATANVQEKLEKDGYGFITALLGSSANKKDFFENKQVNIPDLKQWTLENIEVKNLYEELKNIDKNLENLLEKQNKMVKLKEKLSKYKVEQKYFETYFKEGYITTSNYSLFPKWSSNLILHFMPYYERIMLKQKHINLFTRVAWFVDYGIYKFKYVSENENSVMTSLKRDYYNRIIKKTEQEISVLESDLEEKSYKKQMEQFIDISSKIFKASMQKRYSKGVRKNYTVKSFKYNFEEFIQDYPVVLSTTNSIKTCISENYLFDYLIIDEASQVDLVTASLAFACCKNVVIVGDVKQLPQIVSQNTQKISDKLFYHVNIGEAYNYSKYSIIASLMNLYKDELPRTLLSEHYRCHPKIIGFCNEKFYGNKLVIMTEAKENDVPLKIFKTAPGNHARKDKLSDEKGWCNIRQIEVIRDEIVNGNKDKYKEGSKVGIICPYRRQVTEANKYFEKSKIEVDTVHKFQGREKDTIIFSTVVNDINSFVDDENLINVAVSRAVKEFIMVTSKKLFKQHGTNIGDLTRYIEYNSLDADIIESPKVSVFDLLYSEYSDKLLKIMSSSKHVSKYKSENLMHSVIEEVLTYSEYISFKCVIHIPLNSIVKDFTKLNDEQKAFAKNPWSHVDFLIFNRLDKEPVLVVEVDGYEYHANNKDQKRRDAVKDKILEQIKLPILRVATNESGEKEKLIKMLDLIIKKSGESDCEMGDLEEVKAEEI